MAKKKAAPAATEEIVVVKKAARITKPSKTEAAKKAAPAPAAKATVAVVNLYRAEIFIKKGEKFSEIYVGAVSHAEALDKINSSDAVVKEKAEIQSMYLVNGGANPNTIYIP